MSDNQNDSKVRHFVTLLGTPLLGYVNFFVISPNINQLNGIFKVISRNII